MATLGERFHDIMDAPPPATSFLDGQSCAEALAAKDRRIAELEGQLAEARAESAAMIQTVMHPTWSPSDKIFLIRLAIEGKAATARGETAPDGTVALRSSDIGQDYRPAPEAGERLVPTNLDGTPVLIPRQVVKAKAKTFKAHGLHIELKPVTRTRANGTPYQDTAIVIPDVTRLDSLLDFARHHAAPPPKPRKPYTYQEPCPQCGEIHPLRQDTICTGCGSVIASQTVPVPAASDADATSDQRATIVEPAPMSTRNVDDSNTAPRAPRSPTSLRSVPMSTKNVDIGEPFRPTPRTDLVRDRDRPLPHGTTYPTAPIGGAD